MPELPEVETTKRGISPYLEQQTVERIKIYQPSLRWPVSDDIMMLQGQVIESVSRRGKYILMQTNMGSAVWHLGMSGSLRLSSPGEELKKHDHVQWDINNGWSLRYHDPRRFGCLLFQPVGETLSVLSHLGVEPLTDDFNGEYLYRLSRKKSQPIKVFIMDSKIVTGVGNIYASESLFKAGIHPNRSAGRVSLERYQILAEHIKQVLAYSIEQGGTTLRDFINADGNPGYFKQSLNVYGKQGQPCTSCNAVITSKVIGQRNSFYCPKCQR